MLDMTWSGTRVLLLVLPFFLISCQEKMEYPSEANYNTIPMLPPETTMSSGFFFLHNKQISVADEFKSEAEEFVQFCKKHFDINLTVVGENHLGKSHLVWLLQPSRWY